MTTYSEKVFGELFDSAMKFFDRAIDTFESEIDVSIVHFAISLELVIKSLLVLEHWAFIFENPGKAAISALRDGSLKSVQFKESMERIKCLTPSALQKEEISAYENVSKHRNMIVHYTHSGLSKKSTTDEIKISILTAWYYLHTLLDTKISPRLDASKKELVEKLFKKMRKIEHYWDAVFLTKESIIKGMADGGEIIGVCALCRQNAACISTIPGDHFVFENRKCVVCNHQRTSLQAKCSNCGEIYDLNVDDAVCPECEKHYFDDFEIYSITDDHYSEPVYCSYCQEKKVYRIEDDLFMCGECYEWGESIYTCEYCNTTYLGDEIEDTFLLGCSFCDGRMADLMAKDD